MKKFDHEMGLGLQQNNDGFDSQMAAMQAVVDAAARGVRFGKSRLKAHNRVMSGGHGVTKAYARAKAKRMRKIARRTQRND